MMPNVAAAGEPADRAVVTVLDVRQEIEVLIVFIFPTIAFSNGNRCFDKTDFTNPFDHLEPELVFNAEA